ncbi:MAG: hypothetical protein H9W81_12770 [Enterococcus sp.]|nr:hypothetical protein [Enterococcus sp.]
MELHAEIKSVYAEYRAAVDTFRNDSENKNVGVKARNLRNKVNELKTQESELANELSLAQRDYDGTPTGQNELRAKLNDFDKENGDFNEYSSLSNRMYAGRMLYAWRKNRLQMKRDEENGITVKAKRGKFLTLSDRESQEDVVDTRESILV